MRPHTHMRVMRRQRCIGLATALLGIWLAGVTSASADNPLLRPAPGTTPTQGPSALEVERGRAMSDSLRDRSRDPSRGLRTPDPMREREAQEYRLDADRIQRSLEGPGTVQVTPGNEALRDTLGTGRTLPGGEPPAPRISHGRAKGKPSPVQSSPVPDRKPDPPGN